MIIFKQAILNCHNQAQALARPKRSVGGDTCASEGQYLHENYSSMTLILIFLVEFSSKSSKLLISMA